MRSVITGLFVLAAAVVVSAHVTVAPRESKSGATERYTVHVPTEGQVSTVAVELEIPAGVTVTEVPDAAGAKVDLTREAGRIVRILWTREIKPREAADFTFTAVNPPDGEIAWKARQRFVDGTTADWVGVAGDRRPAAVTRIVASSPASR
jgi:uncharacterized protein YcnI